MPKPSFQQAAALGFVFPGAREWIDNNVARLAQDAALVTTANTTVPVEFTAYIDPLVVEILTAPLNARQVFNEEKKGDWTTSYDKWRSDEIVGQSEPYSDFANGTTSGINSQWMAREQYRFQTSISYGDLEVDLSATAKINLAASKQRSAATILDIDSNKFYLLGVEGHEIYGILNDPNLPASIVAAANGEGSSTKWSAKTTRQIYEDILSLFQQLAKQSQGRITNRDALKLCVSPEMNVMLGRATDFNVSVLTMLQSYFTGAFEIVVLPELASMTAGETVFMIAPEVAGTPTGVLAFGEKIRAGRLIPAESSFRQKFVATTYGGIVLQPFAFASMTGM
jgi:hypothetical protein